MSANGASDYTFNVSSQGHVAITPPTGTALTLGTVTSGAISAAGQQNNFIFTIAAPPTSISNSLTNRCDLTWTLISPAGPTVGSTAFASTDFGLATGPRL